MDGNKLSDLNSKLRQLLSDIDDFKFSPIRHTGRFDREETKEFFICIADLVHLMSTSDICSSILQNLIDKYEKLPKSDHVRSLNADFVDAFAVFGGEILSLPKWKQFCETEEGKHSYVNPFQDTGTTDRYHLLPTADFVRTLSEFTDYSGNTIEQVDTIKAVLIDTQYSLNGILDKYFSFDKDSYNKFADKISECYGKVNTSTKELRELFEYNPRFDGYDSLLEILSIYRNVHPNPTQTPDFTSNLSYFFSVENGILPQEVRQLKKDCTKVVRIIKNSMNLAVMKKHLVSRFKAMCELYESDDLLESLNNAVNPEKVLQKRWEKFAFLNGYYPISEAQLNSGRLDSLITSDMESSFLSEIKQVGFGSIKTNPLTLIKRAMVQAESYKKKLEGFPNMDKNVYILFFTSIPLNVEQDLLEKSGVFFRLEVIQLTKIPDSKRTPIQISIEDVIQE